MSNGDLKVLRVYTQGGKQIGYKVENSYGNVIKADRNQMLQAISYGHKFSNATVTNSGVVRVSSDVPREDISNIQGENQLAYFDLNWNDILSLVKSKDIKKISHSFKINPTGGSFNLQVPVDCPDEIPCKVRHRVIQGYPEDFISEEEVYNLSCEAEFNFLSTFADLYYKDKKRPTGFIIFSFGCIPNEHGDCPGVWDKVYIIEFNHAVTQNEFEKCAIGRYYFTTFYNIFFKAIKDNDIPYKTYKKYVNNFLIPFLTCVNGGMWKDISHIGVPFVNVNVDVGHFDSFICFDKKTYNDIFKICTKLEKLKNEELQG